VAFLIGSYLAVSIVQIAVLVEHEGAMVESTDQRIKKILTSNAKEKKADELEKKLAEEQNNEQQATAERVRQKWAADTYIIAEILKDFEQKMSALGLQLTFQDAGQKGNLLAIGHISGRISGRDLHVTLNVHPAGEIDAFQGPKVGHISSQFTSPSKLSVLTADRTQYEALILDFIEKGA
jgi:hypothetical protein